MENRKDISRCLFDLTVKGGSSGTVLDIFEFNVRSIQNRYDAENIEAQMSCETLATLILESLGEGWTTDILQECAWFKGTKMTLHKKLPENKVIFKW